MFGIPIEGLANLFCDNEAVYKNSLFAESTLKKKHNLICFYRVREAQSYIWLKSCRYLNEVTTWS